MPEAIENGKSGLIVNSEDTGSIARAIVGLLQNHDLMENMGQYGRGRVLSEFSWVNQLKSII